MAKTTKPPLDELRRIASEAEAASQFCRWHAMSAPHVRDEIKSRYLNLSISSNGSPPIFQAAAKASIVDEKLRTGPE